MDKITQRIYEDLEGKRESKPFEGWVYYTEYTWGPDRSSMGTGVNQNLTEAQKRAIAKKMSGG